MTNAHVEENDRSRQRMSDLVNRLSDEQLATPMENDWTVAAYLVHIAFFDRRALELTKRFKTADDVRESPMDVHVLNDSLLPQWRLIPAREAANEAIAAATETDAAIAALPDEIVARVRALDAFSLDRSAHRKTHLDEIEPMFP
jgi:hypothetical protein